jgi:Holliday junction resolvase-like predicted endonuclease
VKRENKNILKIKNNGEYRHRGEMLAANFLRIQGHEIICHNFHAKFAEIDLITFENDVIHFIEVKNHAKNGILHPLELLTRPKRNKMRQASKVFYREYIDYSRKLHSPNKEFKEIIIDIVAFQPSYDLIWVSDDHTFEYFCGVF